MLSYRHAFHAGNHADVLKHAALIHCLEYLKKKDKSFLYVDTHAGAGLYDLTTGFSDRIKEYKGGISKLLEAEHQCEEGDGSSLPPFLRDYVSVIKSFNPKVELEFYPGSPLVAKQLLRAQDQMRLHELHKADHEILYSHTASDSRIFLQQKDGLKGMIKSFPPPSRRGIVLIDPPYENKQDYTVLPYAIDDALFKFANAVILVWYPMLESGLFEDLKEDLAKLPTRSWLNVEMVVREPSQGLYGSGLWIINPPWDLPQALQSSKNSLERLLGETSAAKLEMEFDIP